MADPSVRPAGDPSAACRVLFAHLSGDARAAAAARLLALFDAGEVAPDGLLAAFHPSHPGRPVGAVLTQLAAGRVGVTVPPRADRPDVRDALAAAVVGRFRDHGVAVAQMLLPPDDRPAAAPLEAVGFRWVTRLVSLCRPVSADDAGGFDPDDEPLTFAAVAGPDPAFAAALWATYDGSLDCPELADARTADDVLAGYLEAGPPDWALARADGRPAGVVVFAPPPADGVADLAYLGLVPAARGRRLGDVLVRFALARAAERGAEWVQLTVDARNEPARRLYDRHHFRPVGEQDVFLWRPDW